MTTLYIPDARSPIIWADTLIAYFETHMEGSKVQLYQYGEQHVPYAASGQLMSGVAALGAMLPSMLPEVHSSYAIPKDVEIQKGTAVAAWLHQRWYTITPNAVIALDQVGGPHFFGTGGFFMASAFRSGMSEAEAMDYTAKADPHSNQCIRYDVSTMSRP